jgi:hypothetical protein
MLEDEARDRGEDEVDEDGVDEDEVDEDGVDEDGVDARPWTQPPPSTLHPAPNRERRT